MITKEDLEDLLHETIESGYRFARDGFLDDELDAGEYGYTLGEFYGRQELLIELLRKFD